MAAVRIQKNSDIGAVISHVFPDDSEQAVAHSTRNLTIAEKNLQSALRRAVLQQFHSSQMGASRIKSTTRTYPYWLTMDKDIGAILQGCSKRQQADKLPHTRDPLSLRLATCTTVYLQDHRPNGTWAESIIRAPRGCVQDEVCIDGQIQVRHRNQFHPRLPLLGNNGIPEIPPSSRQKFSLEHSKKSPKRFQLAQHSKFMIEDFHREC
ncbi:hypothetical protein ACTXT7_013624 [Hymenolepis weldensis]